MAGASRTRDAANGPGGGAIPWRVADRVLYLAASPCFPPPASVNGIVPLIRRLLAEGGCELAFTAPFALLGGGLYGYNLAGGAGTAGSLVVALSCALGLTSLVAVQISLEPVVVEAFGGRDGRWGHLAAYLWDAATGAVVGLPLMLLTHVGTIPSVGLALTAGSIYGYLVGAWVCGEASETLLWTLLVGSGGRRRRGYSRIEALEARGDVDGAVEAWRDALRADPGDARPYLALARLLPGRTEGGTEAVRLLREALGRARLTPHQKALAVMRIVELREREGRRAATAPDLARYLEEGASGSAAAWARRVLDEIKASLAQEAQGSRDPAG